MKTFKLKALQIIEDKEQNITHKKIPLQDGLIINREDEDSTWLVEAYINKSYFDYFQSLKVEKKEVTIEVKITKESNAPATFITTIYDINEIGDKMNVLFLGNIIDRRKDRLKETLNGLISEGYEGEELVSEFKKLI